MTGYLQIMHRCPDCEDEVYLEHRELRFEPKPWGGQWHPPEHEPDKLLHCPGCKKNFRFEDVWPTTWVPKCKRSD